jgi:hypothetical protein
VEAALLGRVTVVALRNLAEAAFLAQAVVLQGMKALLKA